MFMSSPPQNRALHDFYFSIFTQGISCVVGDDSLEYCEQPRKQTTGTLTNQSKVLT